jgi:membrane fusion protein (multidrug efflux system)
LQVPRSAVIEDQGTASVFVIEEGLAVRKTIETGYSNRGMVEVTDGLQDGEQVVTVGQASLKQDSRVSIINEAGGPDLAADKTEEDNRDQDSEDATSD